MKILKNIGTTLLIILLPCSIVGSCVSLSKHNIWGFLASAVYIAFCVVAVLSEEARNPNSH